MAAGVGIDEVHRIAALARLGVEAARAASIAAELNGILEHMDVLARVDTDGVPEAASVGLAALPLRADEAPCTPLARPPQSFAPEMRDGFFVVPRLATHEEAAEAS